MDATVAAAVEVTFLRMERPPTDPAPPLPRGTGVVRVPRPTVTFYRYLYHTVGEEYLWWMRRAAADAELAAVLAQPTLSIHVLYVGGEPGGFYELDRRYGPAINLSYFGLFPHVIGRGLGRALLRHAVDAAWAEGPRALTVNTCTADHPRALPSYLATGFVPMRVVPEVWRIPTRLGLRVPARLRA